MLKRIMRLFGQSIEEDQTAGKGDAVRPVGESSNQPVAVGRPVTASEPVAVAEPVAEAVVEPETQAASQPILEPAAEPAGLTARLKRRLLEERDRYLRATDRVPEQDTGISSGDAADRASVAYERSLTDHLSQRDRTTLRRIERALEKFETGEFGICEDCEEPITPRRLEADPTIRLCIQCQEEQEMEARSRNAG